LEDLAGRLEVTGVVLDQAPKVAQASRGDRVIDCGE
jgi:hypothetical protein